MGNQNNKVSQVGAVSTDDVAVSIYNNLLSDFRSIHPYFAQQATSLRVGRPETYRSLNLPSYTDTLEARFKAYYQLDSLLKKYRFQDEQMDRAKLESVTYEKYNTFQASRSTYGILPYRALLVLREARQICRDILGKVDMNEILENCRFGRNSSVGCNFANAYLDVKFSAPEALTGTVGSQAIFERYLQDDALLSRIMRGRLTCLHDVLPLIIVPKKYNIGRTIQPLTLISLFLSHGIGVTVERRLSHSFLHRLDITRLQGLHRFLVRKYSKTLSHATLDMSFGSENITSQLLNYLLPREWYNLLKVTFNRQVTQSGKLHYTESVLPMGNGATFPVETLVFYSLIRAIGNLAKVPGRYSVYGDDVIVPSSCYSYVCTIFKDLGIAINRDKSFNTRPFRESCGADYYKGVTVRPFYIPEGMKCDRKQDKRYTSWLYKCVNGLLARWSPLEVKLTLTSLISELAVATNGKVLLVPPSFPDGCGVKWDDPINPPLPGFMCWSLPECTVHHGTRSYRFKFLLEVPRKRRAVSTVAYLWDKLRTHRESKTLLPNGYLGAEFDGHHVAVIPEVTDAWKTLVFKDHLRYLEYSSPNCITYKRHVKTVTYMDRNGLRKQRLRVSWSAWTPDKQQSTFVVQTAGATSHEPWHERMDPIISDWI